MPRLSPRLPILASYLLMNTVLMTSTATVLIVIVIIGTTAIINMVITAIVAVAPLMRADEYVARRFRR